MDSQKVLVCSARLCCSQERRVKIAGVVAVLVTAGCAVPAKGSLQTADRDMVQGGVGGNGDGLDLSGGNGGGGGVGGSVGPGGSDGGDLAMSLPVDMMIVHDMTLIYDMAMCKVVPPIPNAPCSEFPQCGCAGTQNCDLDRSASATSGMTLCVASGTTAAYNNCTSSQYGQCPKGWSCIGGVCKLFCGATGDCPGANRECTNVVDQNNTAVPGAKICTQNCNPNNPQDTTNGWAACGPNVNCGPGSQTEAFSDCYGPTSATATQGQSCAGSGVGDGPCAPGFICVSSAVAGDFCRHNCRVGQNADCPSGAGTCHPYGTAAYVGTVQYGYCQ
jgi:hypothetical protein